MAAVNQVFERSERIDFAAISKAALAALPSLVQDWLPQGKRQGDEWVSINPTRNDRTPGSFSVNLKKGVWSDFASGDAGGDAIDLLAYLNRISKLDAARELGERLGVTSRAASTSRPTQSAKPTPSPIDLATAPATFPARTRPDKDGNARHSAP